MELVVVPKKNMYIFDSRKDANLVEEKKSNVTNKTFFATIELSNFISISF